MWIIQEPNTLEVWNKLHFEEKKRGVYSMFNLLAPELFFFNFSSPCIKNVNNTGTRYVRIMKQTAFWREKNGEYTPCLTFWRRNYFFKILSHPVYKMRIIQEPNTLELWNKLYFEEKKNGEYTPCLTFWRRNYFFNFSSPCI